MIICTANPGAIREAETLGAVAVIAQPFEAGEFFGAVGDSIS